MTLDALAHRFDTAMALARDRVVTLARAADELRAVRGRAVSPDGAAEAVVDGAGSLVALRLAATVIDRSPAEVGALIVDTVHAAALDAVRRRRQTMVEVVDQLGSGCAPNGASPGHPARSCAGRQYAHGSGP